MRSLSSESNFRLICGLKKSKWSPLSDWPPWERLLRVSLPKSCGPSGDCHFIWAEARVSLYPTVALEIHRRRSDSFQKGWFQNNWFCFTKMWGLWDLLPFLKKFERVGNVLSWRFYHLKYWRVIRYCCRLTIWSCILSVTVCCFIFLFFYWWEARNGSLEISEVFINKKFMLSCLTWLDFCFYLTQNRK